MIGSYDHMIRPDGSYGIIKRGQPKGETEDGVRKHFAANSSYSVGFPMYGALPEANKMAQKKFNPGFGDMKNKSAYMQTFAGEGQEKHRQERKEEKVRVSDHRHRQINGSLKPHSPLPFKGKSSAQSDYSNARKGQTADKILPFSMVSHLTILFFNEFDCYIICEF